MHRAYLLLFSYFPPSLFRREKAAALRFAEHLGGSGAAPSDCRVLGLSATLSATLSPISAWQVPLQKSHSGPQHNLYSSCLLRRKIRQTPAVPSVALSLSVITMNKGKKKLAQAFYKITDFFASSLRAPVSILCPCTPC